MKKLFPLLFVFMLVLSACGAMNEPIGSQAPAQPSPTAYPDQPTLTPYPTQLVPATLPPTVAPPMATAIPPVILNDDGTPECNNHGVTAWNPDNRTDGGTYGEVPIGGLDEICWVVAQTWWTDADGDHRALFAVEPHSVVWLSGHLGGTGWYFSGTLAEVEANLAEQAQQMLERDGEMDTLIIVLPEDADKFPILSRFQVKQ